MPAFVDRLVRQMAYGTVGIILLAGGVVTGLIALYLQLLEILPPHQAMAAIAALLLVSGGILFAIARRKPAPPPQPAAHPAPEAAACMSDPTAAIREAVARDPLGTAVASLAAGFILGTSPALQQVIDRLIRQGLPR